jgi:hypothetical protein
MISTKTKRLSVILSAATLLSAAVGASVIGSAKAEPVSPVVAPTVLREASTSTADPGKFVAFGDDYYSSKVNKYEIPEADAKGTFTYTLSSDGTYYTITGASSNSAAIDGDRALLVFPSYHSNGTSDLPVKAVDITSLTSVATKNIFKMVFGSGITSLNCSAYTNTAFNGSSRYSFLSLPDTLTTLSSLTSSSSFDTSYFAPYVFDTIELPSSLTSLGRFAFSGFKNIVSLDLPSSLTYMDTCSFFNCSSLIHLNIPSSVSYIGSSCFSGCSSLTSISIPELISSIPDNCFYGCSSLSSVVLPTSLTSIGISSFDSCSSLSSVSFPSGLHSIGSYAFRSCPITFASFPSSLFSIATGAFDTTKIKTVVFASLPTIGSSAFSLDGATAIDSVFYYGTDCSPLKKSISPSYNPVLYYAAHWYSYTDVENDDGAHWHYVNGNPVVWGAAVPDSNPTNSSTSSSTDTKTDQKDSDESILMKALSIAGIAVVGLVALLLLMKVCKSFFKVIS